jgi:neutral ceramidase
VRRGLLRALVVVVTLAVGAVGVASVDRCGDWSAGPPALVGLGRARGALRVGAAVVPMAPAYPVTRGGYGPPRSAVRSATMPLAARATVLEVGGQRVALVAVDTLLVPAALRSALQAATGMPTWLAATHTHSSLGGFDRRLAAEVAALGAYDPAQEAAVLAAATAAVAKAAAGLAPARLDVTTAEVPDLTVPRSGDAPERALTRLRFSGERGPVAQWVVFSAHPTLAPRQGDTLDPDWPGRLAARFEHDGGPVTLALQGGGGNASVDRARAATPEDFAAALAGRLDAAAPPTPTDAAGADLELAWAEVAFELPRPDATRLAPWPLRAAAENALCDGAERQASLSAVRLGPATLLLVPVEPSAAAARVLLERAHATRLLSNANGYLGYVEPAAAARAGDGESRRQYFDEGFLARWAGAAALAGEAVGAPR